MIISELDARYPAAAFGEGGYIVVNRNIDLIRRDNNWQLSEWVNLGSWDISLLHQCDEWKIGTPEQGEAVYS